MELISSQLATCTSCRERACFGGTGQDPSGISDSTQAMFGRGYAAEADI